MYNVYFNLITQKSTTAEPLYLKKKKTFVSVQDELHTLSNRIHINVLTNFKNSRTSIKHKINCLGYILEKKSFLSRFIIPYKLILITIEYIQLSLIIRITVHTILSLCNFF